jgi:hypothetical protein
MSPVPRYWRCTRQETGIVCRQLNIAPKRNCVACGKPRPKRRRPKHLDALKMSYEEYVILNGGERCGICGAPPKEGGRRLHRDHDHRTGQARGLLCFRCNAALRPYMDASWLERAYVYVRRNPPLEGENETLN